MSVAGYGRRTDLDVGSKTAVGPITSGHDRAVVNLVDSINLFAHFTEVCKPGRCREACWTRLGWVGMGMGKVHKVRDRRAVRLSFRLYHCMPTFAGW